METTVDKIRKISKNLINRPSNSGCILKLERTNNDLQQLEKKMTSYVYEPNTYTLFIKSETLRQTLESLKNTNAELIKALKREKDLKIELFEKTMAQVRSYLELQNSVEEYCNLLRY
ncbi:hypothetical protein MWU78_09260 [Arenibacter sp. F26102]|uniref:hypothetical protein n=1 Tax=Arenibacter sp. F26102 TaxID=2926416 RepID=UPI001FF692F8|nr:hypothetical protein [Arenibacter sp. F26102]MCK0145830.1 hypothetical protein [Arenibacter sp. F26102]